jgi:CHAT domain-containing protein/Tfp pilus assembly protein PilF
MNEKEGIVRIASVLGLVLTGLIVSRAQSQADIPRPSVGEAVERQISGSEHHGYPVELKRGQVLRVDVQEKGIDVGVALVRISEKQIVAKVDFGTGYGRERLTAVIEQAGGYMVIVEAHKSAISGSYRITVAVKEMATANDREEIRAERLLEEGLASQGKGTEGDLRASITKWEEAIGLWKSLGEEYWEGFTLNALGLAQSSLGDKQKALGYLNQAVLPFRLAGDKRGEGSALSNIGVNYYEIGDKQKALEYFDRAVSLIKIIGDKDGEAAVLLRIGRTYDDLGEADKALDNYSQALALYEMVGDKSSAAVTLNNIGGVYSDLGDKQKALEFLNKALLLWGEGGGKGVLLNNIGEIYSSLGEKQKALEYFDQALPIFVDVGDERGEGIALNNIGGVYDDLGEKQKALGFYKEGFSVFEAITDEADEGTALANIGKIHAQLGDKQNALECYGRALKLLRLFGIKAVEAVVLNDIGRIHDDLGESQEALEFYNQALPLERLVGDKRNEAITLDNIAGVYDDLRDSQNALEYYNQALPLFKLVGDPDGEGITLAGLMVGWSKLGNPRLAVLYGKQSVNAFQQIRSNIQNLDSGIQKRFLASKQEFYRYLTELLISEKRLEEAAQILDLLKLQEFADFINRSGSPDHPTADATFSSSETEIRDQYNQLSSRLFSLNTEYHDLSRKKTRAPEQEQRLKTLDQEIDQAKQAFQRFVAQLPGYFSKPLPTSEVDLEVNGIKPIVRSLGTGSAALYTLMAADRYYVILLSPQLDQARQYYVRRAQLEKKVKQFKEVLQNPRVDPRPTAQELYQILVAPIAKDLQQSDARTLMWSLDGALRYVPMSALYDGQQYLVEKYQNVVIDPTSQGRLREQPEPTTWRGLGLGASKAFVGFKALSNVPDELDGIIRQEGVKDDRGVLPGEKLLDDSFTEAKMYEALKRNYKVVHIASHFVLSSKDARESYLLLGDGGKLKLSQISDGAKIFDQVDLVALSACDTGSGGADADGREVDAFGIITQQKGAKAVLASLWAVDDRSTKDVMVGFYQRVMRGGGMTKAEALSQAQLMLLRGEGGPVTMTEGEAPRGDEPKKAVNVKDMQWEEEPAQGREFKVNPKAPYSHPYYWAPFILIGNWR